MTSVNNTTQTLIADEIDALVDAIDFTARPDVHHQEELALCENCITCCDFGECCIDRSPLSEYCPWLQRHNSIVHHICAVSCDDCTFHPEECPINGIDHSL